MENQNLLSQLHYAVLLMDRMKQHFSMVQENLQKSFHTVIQYHDEIKTIQSKLQSQIKFKLEDLYNKQTQTVNTNEAEAVMNEPITEGEGSNEPKETEPMSVKDAIEFLKKTKTHLSDYGYHLLSSSDKRKVVNCIDKLTLIDSNEPKETEPMSVKDAIEYLRKSKIHLSEYGYHLYSSFETRHAALKKAMEEYPMDRILQKLRALIIVWSQNAMDKIQFAEEYLNHLRADFYTLQEEWLKPKRS